MMKGQADLLNDGKTIEPVDEKLCSFSSDEPEEMYSSSALATCGDNSVATKRNLVEILRFRHFSPHIVFCAEGDKFRNKQIEQYITVCVAIDLGCGNTRN